MPLNFAQNIKFKPAKETRLDEYNFTGGLVTDAHETKLKPEESPDLANLIFNNTGSIKNRNGYLRYNGTPQGAAADQSNTGAATATVAIANPGDYVAQTFQPSGAISCLQVDVYLAMHTSGQEQYARVELWSTSGGAPSALLTNGQSQIKLVTGTSSATYSFYFKEPVSLSASTTYALVIKPFIRGSSQTVKQMDVDRRGSTYANGQIYTSSDSGLNWSAAGNDLRFVVYGGGNTGCTGLIRFYTSTGIQQTIAKFGTSLYRGNDITGALTAITLGSGASLTSANFTDWTISNDTLLVVDDDHYIQKYRGSTNANYSTGTISVTSGDATVTGSGTSWATTTNAEVGEYIQLPDSKWYKITTITDNTHLEIEIADADGGYQGSSLSGQSYTISPWGEIQGQLDTSTANTSLTRPQPKYIENHLNRIWVLDGNSLKFSALDTSVTGEHFNDWDSSNNAGEIILPSGQGDSGTGLYSLNGYLYVFQKHAIWEIFGNSPSNFELRQISNEVGLVDRRTLVEYDRYLIFFSGKDVYLFDGTNLKNLSDGRVNTYINSWANITSPAAVLWQNKYVLTNTVSGGSYNSEALFYDITRDKFGKLENVYANIWSTWKGGTDSNQIYFGSSNQGTIYLWNTGGHDDGYELPLRYSTGSLAFGLNTNDKSLKKVYLQQLALGDWDMTVTQYSDITEDTLTSSINLLAGGGTALWDTAVWDTDSWSSEGTLSTTRVNEFQGTAKYFKYVFEQSGYNEGIELLGLTSVVRTRRLT